MAEQKTMKTGASVKAFLDAVEDPRRKADAKKVLAMMRRVTGERPAMWGSSIVGFGQYEYTYASGRSGVWPISGFSPRKRDLTVYVMSGFEAYEKHLRNLGRHKTGKSCLYLRSLDDVDMDVLEEIVADSVEVMRRKYPPNDAPNKKKTKKKTKRSVSAKK